MTRFDVTIIGGGVAGLAAAIALRSAGCSVAIVERGHYERSQITETLPPEVKIPLVALNLWNSFLTLSNTQTVSRLSAWGSRQLDEADYLFNAYGNGWLVARPAFDQMLAERAVQAGVALFRNTRLQACEKGADRSWRLILSETAPSRTIFGKFAVIATGRGSSMLRKSRERKLSADRMIAIVARVMRPANWPLDDTRPLIESAPDGWWFSVLQSHEYVDLAMMTDSDIARAQIRRHGSLAATLGALLSAAPHTCERLGCRMAFCLPVRIVAANTYMTGRVIDDSRLAVGDAAQAVDPLAGQGSFAALDGGIRAANAIFEYFHKGAASLRRYAQQEWRRFDELLVARSAYYRIERRWPQSPFWLRRQADISRSSIRSRTDFYKSVSAD